MTTRILETYTRGNGVVRLNTAIPAKTVSLTTAEQVQDAVQLDSTRGDVVGFLVEITGNLTTGSSLSGALTMADFLANFSLKDPSGVNIWSNISGARLVSVARKRGEGILNTPQTITTSAQNYQIFVPWVIKNRELPAKLQVTVAAYDDLVSSGATGGSVTFEIKTIHRKESGVPRTLRMASQDVTTVNGTGRFQDALLDGQIIEDVYMYTDESNITSFTFTRNGSAEMEELTPEDIETMDDYLTPGKHVTDELDLYMSPFVKDTATRLQVIASAAQNLELIQIYTDAQ